MIILRKAKYGTGYRDLGHVARVIRTKLIHSLYIEYDSQIIQVHYNLRFYW